MALARRLALAHHIERLVESGTLKDYAAAARVLGITRARLTQLMDLFLLPGAVQEAVLTGELRISERQIKARHGLPGLNGCRPRNGSSPG